VGVAVTQDKTLSIFMKRIRLNHNDQTMVEMAKNLGISVSFLSSIENGKRNMSEEMFRLICDKYKLSPKLAEELKQLRTLSVSKINVPLDSMSSELKSTTVKFLSSADELSEADLKKINSILNKKRGKQ
jgi:HTH-type transcriptional regulator, competence development regulator